MTEAKKEELWLAFVAGCTLKIDPMHPDARKVFEKWIEYFNEAEAMEKAE